jgi:Flp pilus assembly protein TadD
MWRLLVSVFPVCILVSLAACGASALPKEAVHYNGQGAELLDRGELDQAEASFRLALEFHPRFSEPHANLGAVAIERGALHAAEKHLRTAIDLNEDFAQAWANLGVAEERLGRLDAAERDYERALSIDPGLAVARRNLALLLIHRGRLREARAELLRLAQIRPDSDLRAMLSYAEARLGGTKTNDFMTPAPPSVPE